MTTPPKWIAAQHNRESRMNLENQLRSFIKWLGDKEVWLVTGMDNALRPNEIDDLIEEYVNT